MRTLVTILLFGVAVMALSVGTAQESAPKVELVDQPCDTHSARVYVSEQGVVSLNGANIPIESLQPSLRKLLSRIKSVCYSRANPEAFEPHPAALKALDAIAELNLPIAFYWDAEFKKRVHFKE